MGAFITLQARPPAQRRISHQMCCSVRFCIGAASSLQPRENADIPALLWQKPARVTEQGICQPVHSSFVTKNVQLQISETPLKIRYQVYVHVASPLASPIRDLVSVSPARSLSEPHVGETEDEDLAFKGLREDGQSRLLQSRSAPPSLPYVEISQTTPRAHRDPTS